MWMPAMLEVNCKTIVPVCVTTGNPRPFYCHPNLLQLTTFTWRLQGQQTTKMTQILRDDDWNETVAFTIDLNGEVVGSQ